MKTEHYIIIAALLLWALLFTNSFIQNKRDKENYLARIEYNNKVIADTVLHYKKVYDKIYAQNHVLRLTADELGKSNNQLSKDVKRLSGRLKNALSATQVRIEHDTIEVPVVVQEDCSFDYADSCLSVSLRDSMLRYNIAQSNITIVQHREGNEVIASVSVDGCGAIKGINSFVLEEQKKRTPWWKHPLTWFGIGFVAGSIF